ncbi:hypothetical protein B0J14DRAFT_173469 [Halenospora varia]|nr:hypothetical protein B0J14DRAFT_173469 [Halenospora varia]
MNRFGIINRSPPMSPLSILGATPSPPTSPSFWSNPPFSHIPAAAVRPANMSQQAAVNVPVGQLPAGPVAGPAGPLVAAAGVPAAVALPANLPKRRGRPPTKVKSDPNAAPKRRGRPPKPKPEVDPNAVPKRRGRPPKSLAAATPQAESPPPYGAPMSRGATRSASREPVPMATIKQDPTPGHNPHVAVAAPRHRSVAAPAVAVPSVPHPEVTPRAVAPPQPLAELPPVRKRKGFSDKPFSAADNNGDEDNEVSRPVKKQRVEQDDVAEGPIRKKRVLSTLIEEDGEDEDGEAIEMPALKKFKAAETASVVKAPATLPLAQPRKGRQPLGLPTSEPATSFVRGERAIATIGSSSKSLAAVASTSKPTTGTVAAEEKKPAAKKQSGEKKNVSWAEPRTVAEQKLSGKKIPAAKKPAPAAAKKPAAKKPTSSSPPRRSNRNPRPSDRAIESRRAEAAAKGQELPEDFPAPLTAAQQFIISRNKDPELAGTLADDRIIIPEDRPQPPSPILPPRPAGPEIPAEEGRFAYFAYGPEMDMNYMDLHHPGAQYHSLAKLSGHRWYINEHEKVKIEKCEGQDVWGYIYALSERDYDLLCAKEKDEEYGVEVQQIEVTQFAREKSIGWFGTEIEKDLINHGTITVNALVGLPRNSVEGGIERKEAVYMPPNIEIPAPASTIYGRDGNFLLGPLLLGPPTVAVALGVLEADNHFAWQRKSERPGFKGKGRNGKAFNNPQAALEMGFKVKVELADGTTEWRSNAELHNGMNVAMMGVHEEGMDCRYVAGVLRHWVTMAEKTAGGWMYRD